MEYKWDMIGITVGATVLMVAALAIAVVTEQARVAAISACM